MDEKNIFKALGELKEEYIEEASYEKEKRGMKERNFLTGRRFRWTYGIIALFTVVMIGTYAPSLFNMGSASSYDMVQSAESSSTFSTSQKKTDKTDTNGLYIPYEESQTEDRISVKDSVDALGKENLKLIYTADIYLQTTDFEKAEIALKEKISQVGGYIQNINQNNGGYFAEQNYLYADYSVRVPSEKYQEFLEQLGNICHVVSLSQRVEDVGENYYEIESRHKTLKIKEERLQALLKQASELSDIIALESELAQVQAEIDNYQSRLNHYDNLIGYSTINVTLESVSRVDGGLSEGNGFWSRLQRNFERGITNFITSCENFVFFLAEHVIGIVILAGISIGILRFQWIRKLRDKIQSRK